MTELKLVSMHIENFKGVRDLEVKFGGERTEITGRNGSGKSTIADAFYWVLFNTDSKGNAPGSDKFREKPLGDDGLELHGLDTAVELNCMLNGLPFVMKRTQREIWSKKRGFVEEVFGGNESTYQINGLDVKVSEFKKRVAEIAELDKLELLASLGEFNRRPWKERRQVLLSMCDVDADAALLVRDEYRMIADECATAGVSVDDLRKVVDDRRKAINRDLQMLPVRIDEATKALPDETGTELADAQYLIADAEKDLAKIDDAIAAAKAEREASNAHALIINLENEAAEIKRGMLAEFDRKQTEINARITAHMAAKQRVIGYMDDSKARLAMAQKSVEALIKQRDALRAEFFAARDRVIVKQETCELCGQQLPEALAKEMLDKAKERQAAEKKEIQDRGKAKAAEVEQAKQTVERLIADIDKMTAQLEAEVNGMEAAQKELGELGVMPNYAGNARLSEIAAQIAELNTDGVAAADSKVAGLERRKAELQEIVNRKRAIVAKHEAAQDTKKRIEALKDQQTVQGKELAKAEKTLNLVEQFIRERCGMLTDSVNGLFPTVRWKLFNTLINGGLEDVCTCQIPCASGLVSYETANTAAQVCADIEIIKALSERYGVRIPLFVDRAESVNLIPEAGTQTIVLAVSNGELSIN